MCGLITIIKRKQDGVNTAATVLGMLQKQIMRGQNGFGYVGFGDKLDSYTRRETRGEIETCLGKNTSQSILFHHRMPTSTPNYADCTHPIKVSHKELQYNYYVTHNGVISNDSVLRDKHLELGYKYTTTVEIINKTENNIITHTKWNDSEALAINIARFIEKKDERIEAKGSIAFVVLREDKVNKATNDIFFGRNSNPLTINLTDDTLVLRSEGESEDTSPNILYHFDIKKWKLDEYEVDLGEIMSQRYPTHYHHDLDEEREYFTSPRRRPANADHISIPACDAAPSDDDIESEIIAEETEERLAKVDDRIDNIEEQIAQLKDDIEFYSMGGNDEIVSEAYDTIARLEVIRLRLYDERDQILDDSCGIVNLEEVIEKEQTINHA